MLKKTARLVFSVTIQDNQIIVNVPFHFYECTNELFVHIHGKAVLVLTAFSRDVSMSSKIFIELHVLFKR